MDILEEDTRKYWTRCDNIGRVEDESNIVTSSPNISLYPPKKGNPILLLYYLDHPSEMMNSLSEQKILKIDDTGHKFSKILGKYYETSFIHNSSFRSP